MAENIKNKGVEILCIGTELLLGNILNSNAQWLAEQLALIGLPHYRQGVIGDNSKRLQEIVVEASQRSQVLITTGGLGPTIDDLTTEAIVKAFGENLIEDQKILEEIKKKFNDQDSFPKSNFKQALFPKDSTVIPNKIGTAPGMIWSPKKDFTIITLPGVPAEMKRMWKDTLELWLSNQFKEKGIIRSTVLKFSGISESSLAEKIPTLLIKKNPTIAPYASLGEVKVRITAQAKTNEEAIKLIIPIESELCDRIGLNPFGKNHETLASVVIDLLRKRSETLTIAESCTGGRIASALTSVPGSSDVFLGGVIAYNNSIKQKVLGVPNELINKYGAVSEQVAKEMALGALQKFQADWSIAISGVAGPSGGTPTKPIGLVELCIASPKGIQSTQENFGVHRAREGIQKLSVVRALDKLRLALLKQS
ncbi:Molybdopterin binding motif [Prochlorococcus sp. MIT 0602]|uniref:competence/damage-inducible protein A n=1 Tax=Prochlorococcus sp. MIT 0602 TaxID=1499499 RepID=UPI0005338859|nr:MULTISPECIES: competence/damage-inducible protein A [unclassified Prochlorococcus]KGG16672.1 Molybdopterin binding motif [Prochlorococcus sp. MIT 0602]KGG18356.1 Molybdopterin binding motif [Prochlorococcus sp. MIT 0603]